MHINKSLSYFDMQCTQLAIYKQLCSTAVKDVHQGMRGRWIWEELVGACSQYVVPDLAKQMVTILKQAANGGLHDTHLTYMLSCMMP